MENLKITPLTEKDSKEYLEIVKEAYVKGSPMRKYSPGFAVQTENEYWDLLNSFKSLGSTLLGIRMPDNKLIGAIGLENVFEPHAYEVSFMISEPFRGKHYASEALAILIQKLRKKDIKKLIFNVSKENTISLNIIDSKLGAKFDHDFEDDMEIHILDI